MADGTPHHTFNINILVDPASGSTGAVPGGGSVTRERRESTPSGEAAPTPKALEYDTGGLPPQQQQPSVDADGRVLRELYSKFVLYQQRFEAATQDAASQRAAAQMKDEDIAARDQIISVLATTLQTKEEDEKALRQEVLRLELEVATLRQYLTHATGGEGAALAAVSPCQAAPTWQERLITEQFRLIQDLSARLGVPAPAVAPPPPPTGGTTATTLSIPPMLMLNTPAAGPASPANTLMNTTLRIPQDGAAREESVHSGNVLGSQTEVPAAAAAEGSAQAAAPTEERAVFTAPSEPNHLAQPPNVFARPSSVLHSTSSQQIPTNSAILSRASSIAQSRGPVATPRSAPMSAAAATPPAQKANTAVAYPGQEVTLSSVASATPPLRPQESWASGASLASASPAQKPNTALTYPGQEVMVSGLASVVSNASRGGGDVAASLKALGSIYSQQGRSNASVESGAPAAKPNTAVTYPGQEVALSARSSAVSSVRRAGSSTAPEHADPSPSREPSAAQGLSRHSSHANQSHASPSREPSIHQSVSRQGSAARSSASRVGSRVMERQASATGFSDGGNNSQRAGSSSQVGTADRAPSAVQSHGASEAEATSNAGAL